MTSSTANQEPFLLCGLATGPQKPAPKRIAVARKEQPMSVRVGADSAANRWARPIDGAAFERRSELFSFSFSLLFVFFFFFFFFWRFFLVGLSNLTFPFKCLCDNGVPLEMRTNNFSPATHSIRLLLSNLYKRVSWVLLGFTEFYRVLSSFI